jgi:hypothetical protein
LHQKQKTKDMEKTNLEGLREHPKGGAPLQDNHMESILQRLFPEAQFRAER